jgi:GT2 family glycosyltransferase
MDGMSISVVLPTSRRAEALRHTFPLIREIRGVDEIIVVPDGPRDPAVELLRQEPDSRVRVEAVPRGAGSPAARNLGARLASGTWVLFLEDDCGFPPGYAEVLRAEAERHEADIVGGPMVEPKPGERLSEAVARAKSERAGPRTIDEIAAFPDRPLFTPFLPAPSLVDREVFDRLAFDEGFLANAYREETDFFLRARRAGFRCLLTPETFFWAAGRWPGGNHRGPLQDEWWRLRNNRRFIHRHGDWLRAQGLVASPELEAVRFVGRRIRLLASGRVQRPPRRGIGEPWTNP